MLIGQTAEGLPEFGAEVVVPSFSLYGFKNDARYIISLPS